MLRTLLLTAGLLLVTAARAGGPLQGVVDLLVEYLEVRYPGHDLSGDVLYVSVHRQALFHVRGQRLLRVYPVATAKAGVGAADGSLRTPPGLHRISEKFGEGLPEFGILKDRLFTGEFADPDFAGVDKDWITSRILWLEGLEPGVNQGGQVDSHARYIYIHGTANEKSVGTASSMGCVRMRNADIIHLYEQVPVGALVVILDN
ncbi:MAG: L,D-transpeptidase family protein [Flavobacteriales bacterium]